MMSQFKEGIRSKVCCACTMKILFYRDAYMVVCLYVVDNKLHDGYIAHVAFKHPGHITSIILGTIVHI